MSDHADVPADPKQPGELGVSAYPAYVEFTARLNVESEYEFDQMRKQVGDVLRSWSTMRLHGDEAAVQLLYRKRPGVRPIESDPQEPPPFTFERADTFYGVAARMWASSDGLASVLRQEADDEPHLHQTMWNTERDRALLRTAADRIETLARETLALRAENEELRKALEVIASDPMKAVDPAAARYAEAFLADPEKVE